jgi:hypothetical protein
VVYSEEEPLKPILDPDIQEDTEKRTIPASNAFVPAAAGIILGGEVVKDLIQQAHTARITPEEAVDNTFAQIAAHKAETQQKKFEETKQKL